jgi:cytochrome b561
MEGAAAPRRWSGWIIALHWLAVMLVAAQLALGLRMTSGQADPADKLADLPAHQTLGILILALTLVRIMLRLRPRPPHPEHSRLLRLVGASTHVALYVLLVALPVTGMLMAASAPASSPAALFGLVNWPTPPLLDAQAHSAFKSAHDYCASALMVFATLHVAAVFKHLFWDQDSVFQSMLPKF